MVLAQSFIENGDVIPLVAIIGGLFIAVIAIVFGTVSSTRKAARREETRREIAAYVAEGSMTAEEGERLMKAGDVPDEQATLHKEPGMLAMLSGPEVDSLIKLIAVSGGISLGALWIVCTSVRSVSKARAQEESRRELAAYVAEGSMTPEDAERLMKAGRPAWEDRCGC
eukprot:TRINITY_DN1538_c0_g4_i1.p2 TRINITY_DN1538_c0_g4~~TRINITY_DN1538_c0_g4_i1.p2  ORF type:complete len:169 (+),score=15.90 TRINITY_DN1538_c0_g4_i1:287-793(+)